MLWLSHFIVVIIFSSTKTFSNKSLIFGLTTMYFSYKSLITYKGEVGSPIEIAFRKDVLIMACGSGKGGGSSKGSKSKGGKKRGK